MEDNQLYAVFLKTIGAVLITLFICITGSCQNTKWTVAKMVEAGAEPMDAACSLGAVVEHNSCLIREVKK